MIMGLQSITFEKQHSHMSACIHIPHSPAITHKCPCTPTFTHTQTYSHLSLITQKLHTITHTCKQNVDSCYLYVKECWLIFVKWYYGAANGFFSLTEVLCKKKESRPCHWCQSTVFTVSLFTYTVYVKCHYSKLSITMFKC